MVGAGFNVQPDGRSALWLLIECYSEATQVRHRILYATGQTTEEIIQSVDSLDLFAVTVHPGKDDFPQLLRAFNEMGASPLSRPAGEVGSVLA